MAQIVEGFETSTPLVARSGTWVRATDQKRSGTYSLKTATVAHSGSSDCVMTVPSGAQTVTFWAKLSTEAGAGGANWDPFIFSIGSTERYRNWGEVGWLQVGPYSVVGASVITFRYQRDNTGDGVSNAVWIDDVVFEVIPPDPQPPTSPPNLRVTSMSPLDVALAWDAATDNTAVTGYGVYKDGVQQDGNQTALTRTLTGLTPGTSYTLAVDAVDAVGNRSAKTSIVQTTPTPSLPGGEGRTRTFLGLPVGRNYLVEIDALDGAGNRSAKASLLVVTDNTPPTVPGVLRATSVSGTQISVAWDASTDHITGVLGYGIYLDGVQVATQHTGLGWTFQALTPGRTYTIAVDAVDGGGNRSAKASLSLQAQVDTEPPSAPANVRVTAASPYTLVVAWDASTDSGGMAGYGVHLNGNKVGPDQLGLTYSFSGLTPQATYQVTVDAADVSGNRSSMAQLTHVAPADQPPATPTGIHVTAVSYTSFTVKWEAAADDVQVSGYDVAVNGHTVLTNANVLEYAMSGLPDDTVFAVQVRAVDHIGQRSVASAELTVTTLNDHDPSTPAFTVSADEDSITVEWAASTDDFGVVGYEVKMDGNVVHTTSGVDYSVDGVITRRHTVHGLAAGRTYGLQVRAVDTIGQRSADNTLQVQTTPLPYMPIETPVYRLGDYWAGNARDSWGVDWVVTGAEGWSSSPPVSPTGADLGGTDGAWAGAGRYGPRLIVLSGVAIAPTRTAMLAAKQRLARVIVPRQQTLLRVIDARMARQARVRLADRIETTDRTAQVFEWRIPLMAADPRRYATAPVRAAAAVAALPGEASMVVTLEGTYRTIPARLRLFGPIMNWTITHEESGTVMRAARGKFVPADTRYSYTIDLGARQVWGHVPPEVWPAPRPGRGGGGGGRGGGVVDNGVINKTQAGD
ncbi:fibronectin type III domain-containing protein, partial [Nonomuraea sp. NPDC026600]|uniref:fibronectin type III domain-containing protein n=1 Tax=Nonomuraea sp. NPDC026600 TaxID=3155363 RepID=UPI0033D354B3